MFQKFWQTYYTKPVSPRKKEIDVVSSENSVLLSALLALILRAIISRVNLVTNHVQLNMHYFGAILEKYRHSTYESTNYGVMIPYTLRYEL